MRAALAFLCQIGAILLTAGSLLMLVLFATMGGGAVIHINPIALAAWIALDAVLIYYSVQLSRKPRNPDPLPSVQG